MRYISNNSRAFKTFVTNRVQAFQEYNSANQLSYIPSEDNPVNDASRGMAFKNFSNITRRVFRVQHFYGNHNQVVRSLQLKKQTKMVHLISNGRSR